MAERSNAEKIAAGRRKLKEFQQKCKANSPVLNKKSREVLKEDNGDDSSRSVTHKCQPEVSHPIEVKEEKEDSTQLEEGRNGVTDIFIDKKPDVPSSGSISTPQSSVSDTDPVTEDNKNARSPQHSMSPERSSTEALRQLALQMDDLVSDPLLCGTNSNSIFQENDSRNGLEFELQNRNQELAGMLEEEKRQADTLRVQIKECRSRILQLESERESLVAESNVRLERELRPLREQLQVHVQTVGVLVGEKTELSAALCRSQVVAKQKSDQVEELQAKLRDSQLRITELIRELSVANEERDAMKEHASKADANLSNYSERLNQMGLQLEERSQEVSEVRQKLSLRTNEVSTLQKELERVKSKLSLTRLRLRQLTGEGGDEDSLGINSGDEAAESWHQHRLRLERQNEELHKTVKEVVEEREEATRRFQTYITTLNSQMAALARKVESLTSDNKTLSEREQQLVRHISELEKQMQKSNSKPNPNELEETSAKLAVVEEKLATWQLQLNEKTEELELLRTKLKDTVLKMQELERELDAERKQREELAMAEDEGSRHERERLLLEAMESDKVAASRAVDQNLKLKAQVAELQDAFVKLSNDKLQLTESLNKSQHLSKEQNEKVLDLEKQIQHLRLKQEMDMMREEQLEQKNEERVAALEARVNMLQLEREQMKEELRRLKEKDGSTDVDQDNSKESETAVNGELPKANEDGDKEQGTRLSETEAVHKLEERFRCAMEELAAVTEEKQRLEHLVLQLQGETETIGEYVALYQTQRGLLRKRAREKDEQLRNLAKDREELRSKLSTLESLVRRLIHEKEGKDHPNTVVEHTEEVKECLGEPEVLAEVHSTSIHSEVNKTAGQIMALFAEIGSNNSLSNSIPSSFHPCPWCSGQLLTI